MITKELLSKALNTAHEPCQNSEIGCTHADAFGDCAAELSDNIAAAIVGGSVTIGASRAIFFEGLHVGYRLAQLEAQQLAATQVPPKKGKH